MRRTNKVFSFLICFIEKVFRIVLLIKMNMNLYEIFLINKLLKTKKNIFFMNIEQKKEN